MRKDMKDVIVNTVRGYDIWGAYPNRKLREEYPLDLDDDDSNIVVYVPQKKTKTKVFSDRLNPLVRFLEKNVGRRWSDVYAEISQHTDYRCVRGRHLRNHVFDDVFVRGVGRRYGFLQRWYSFYVDENDVLRVGYPNF